MPTSCRRCVHCKKKVGGNTVSERTNIHQKSRDFGRSITTRSDLDTWIWWSFGTPISGQTSVSEEILLFGGLPQRARRAQDIVEKGWQVLGQDRWAEYQRDSKAIGVLQRCRLFLLSFTAASHDMYSSTSWDQKILNTVDGRNPAPPDMHETL